VMGIRYFVGCEAGEEQDEHVVLFDGTIGVPLPLPIFRGDNAIGVTAIEEAEDFLAFAAEQYPQRYGRPLAEASHVGLHEIHIDWARQHSRRLRAFVARRNAEQGAA
jgi:hypothetical protein